jgi:pSer/pThr/pTyr-binding forkhead associated (FHA) protein
LRDPKVSRHHAEIVFERGFFVLHDLASANGTYVNSKRVRVAPLTHGANLRMGNTYGRFSEELPTENDEKQEPFEQPIPQSQDVGAIPTSEHDSYTPLATQPHDKVAADELKKKVN